MQDIRSSKAPLTSADEMWHAEEASTILEAFRVTEDGLTEREVKKRRQKYGRNVFSEVPEPGVLARILKQLKSPLALVLVAAAVITFVLHEYVDTVVISFALTLAVVVGLIQEGKASRAFRKLADSQVHMATVIRGGMKHEVEAADVVLGDILEVQGGQQVSADVRLLTVKKLEVNEAALTGEWLPVRKHADVLPLGASIAERENMLFKGTYAVEGHGLGVVVAIGDDTEVGELAENLHVVADEETPLQAEMRRISRFMLFIITGLVLLIFAVGIYMEHTLTEMLLMSIAIAVASIPEGLPAAVTIVLAVGMEMLLKRGGLVRNLLAAETLGSTTFVLTDKTGTLTMARMALTGVIHNDTVNLAPASWDDDAAIELMFQTALCASDAYADRTKEETVLRGDAIERAILGAAEELGIHAEKDSWRANRIDHLPFSSDNRIAAGLAPYKRQARLCVNGAPEYLLEMATHIHEDGVARTIKEEDRLAYLSAISAQTKEGKRLIAVAYKDVSYREIPEDDGAAALIEDGLVFMGIFIFNDPVRKRVGAAIRGVQNAGANVLLITGDNPQTALSVARAVGIAGPHETALTGDDITELSDEELYEVVETVHVFARILPKQKMRIAQVLQSRGEIVAMTGDGINDAPALRRANIGIAVGSGTEVAKEASDLILMDDSFEIIYAAIEEGRRVVSNLRKIVGYLVSTSLSEVVLIAAALLTGAALPLLPAQILWANVIEEGLMSFAFAFEKGEKDAMKQKPQDIYAEGILSTAMLWFIVFAVTVLSAIMLTLYFYLRSVGTPIEELRSVMFLMVAVDSLFMAFAFRSLTTPIWKIPLRTNLFFLGSFTVSAGLLAIVLTIPFFQYLLSYQPLPMEDILLVIGFSIATLMTVEVGKWLFFERQNDRVTTG